MGCCARDEGTATPQHLCACAPLGARRVLLRDADGSTINHALVRIDRPILRIPMLAIHLQVRSAPELLLAPTCG